MATTPKSSKALVMKFVDTNGSKVRSVRLTNPRADITDAEVQAVMDTIVRIAPFVVLGPKPKIKSAQIVDQTKSDFSLTVE